VYAHPIVNPHATNPPAPAGWLKSTPHLIVCQQGFPRDVYYHPIRGWRNYWWGYVRSDTGSWGWVPEVFFAGGNDDEADGGLRACPTSPAPPPKPTPAPTPPPPAPAAPVDPCDPLPAVNGLRVNAGIVVPHHRRRLAFTAGYRKVVHITGIVTDPSGPLANASVCVAARNAVFGAGRHTAATIQTDAEGRFSYSWRTGASRRIWFVHRDGSGGAEASVMVRVRPRVTLHGPRKSLRNGQVLVLSGTLHGRPLPAGVLVSLQARRGKGWQTFGTAAARANGHFSYTYRFTRTFGIQSYTLRALVPKQVGYPFTTGTSHTVVVHVRG
jgi:hypothetical protein